MEEVALDGGPLTIAQVVSVANGAGVGVSEAGRENARVSREKLENLEATGARLYGVNTGFGPLRSEVIGERDRVALQRNLIRSHAVGVGEPLDERVVRAAMLLLAASHLRGKSGVGPEAADLLAQMLNSNVSPTVPSQGSLGSSGDLAPLAHLALHLIGDVDTGLGALELKSKMGLSLINGTHVHTAMAALLVHEAETLSKAADIACAMLVDALLCSSQPFRADVHATRPHSHQGVSARNISRMLEGSELVQSHVGCDEVQDAYSFRCAAQVHGAARQAIAHLREVVEVELQSVTDNPLVIGNEVISAGHFHGEPVGIALDYFKLGVSELASISERRTERALNKEHNRGLPAFLVAQPGLHSGLMIMQYTAASLINENRVLVHPASADNTPTGANQEDFNSMAMTAALHARRVIENARHVIAIELIAAAQALDCRRVIQPHKPGRGNAVAWQAIRKLSAHVSEDRSLANDIEAFDIEAVVDAVGDLD